MDDDLGVALFQETSIFIYNYISYMTKNNFFCVCFRGCLKFSGNNPNSNGIEPELFIFFKSHFKGITPHFHQVQARECSRSLAIPDQPATVVLTHCCW